MTSVLSYFLSCIIVTAVHGTMLMNVYSNGNYSSISDIILLSAAVIGLDAVYFIIMPFFRQRTYAVDFMLLLILNMSQILQSSFGGVHFETKHYITCIAALISCRIGFVLCRNHRWIQTKKKFMWAGIGVLLIVILLFTGDRSMWIDFGFMSIQPSEFIKPLLILACATSIAEQQNRRKIGEINVVYDNLIIFGITAVVILFQWWCRDLGSIPIFAAIYASCFFLRICYPKAKFSRKTIIIAGSVAAVAAIIAIILAPAYVKARLFADIWSNPDEDGYQQTKALIAIAEGGWLGKGPGKGFLNEVFAYESDIVFATISEEWGLLFAIMVVLVLVILAAAPLVNPPRSYYHGTMCAGVCAAFTMQMALNIFGSCNMIPFTGVTLPFVSTGGSSMVTSGFMVGVIVASQSPVFSGNSPKRRSRKRSRI